MQSVIKELDGHKADKEKAKRMVKEAQALKKQETKEQREQETKEQRRLKSRNKKRKTHEGGTSAPSKKGKRGNE
jgi:hypothetical protein